MGVLQLRTAGPTGLHGVFSQNSTSSSNSNCKKGCSSIFNRENCKNTLKTARRQPNKQSTNLRSHVAES